MWRCVRWLWVMCAVGWAASLSAAELDEVLGPVSWGAPHLEVCKSVEDQIMADFKNAAKNVVDVAKRDAMRRRYESDFDSIKQSFRPLKDRTSSGLTASIVSDEFVEGNGEAVLVVPDEMMTRYYFFVDNQLYKIAIAYTPEALKGVSFLDFIALFAKRYGMAFTESYDADDFLTSVVWESEGTRLRVEDHIPIYKTFLVVFTDVTLEAKVADKHAAAKAEREAQWAATSAELEDLTADPEDGTETSAASDIIGDVKGIDVPEGVGPNGEKEGVEANATESKTGDEKKRKRRRGSVKRKKGSKGIKASDLEASPDNEPLIAF